MKKVVVGLVVGLFIVGCSNVHLNFDKGVSGQKNIQKHFLFESVAMVSDETVDGNGALIGSAFAIDKDRLVTAAHVCEAIKIYQLVGKLQKNIKLTVTDEKGNQRKLEKVKIIRYQSDYDLCVLEKKGHKIPPVQLMTNEEYDNLLVGSPATIIGAPAGIFPIITQGYISSFSGNMPDFWEKGNLTVSAACYGGNSGGPIFQGTKVIGILVMGLESYSNACFGTDVKILNRFLKELEIK